jgi:polyvinyl alcohol dehydrogenase (cytochrome)
MYPFPLCPKWPSCVRAARWATAVVLLSFGSTLYADDDSQWPIAGQNLANTRSQPDETKIGVNNVAGLKPKWVFTSGGDISATPTVTGNAVYFPDWSGRLYAVRKNDGRLLWSQRISDYTGDPTAISRVSPAVNGDDLIIGDNHRTSVVHDGAMVMAVSRHTGQLRWITRVESHGAAIITGAPVVYNNVVYVGVSSQEESLATDPNYPCCSFRGSMVALNASTGHILWQTYVMPDNHNQPGGYSGGAIWQPPAIDPARRSLYVGTGNNYTVPPEVQSCIESAPNETAKIACLDPNDHYDAAISLDLGTGRINWSRRLQGVDVWTVACLRNTNPAACPLPSSPDFDMGGSGPNLFANLVGFGQKSGIYWALNPDTGAMVWSSVVGPGSTLGGIEWGTATDGKRIYAAVTNNAHLAYPLVNGQTITYGAWSALDVATGRILWQTADPAGAVDMGAVSVANGVLYAPSFSGNMHALDAATGKILWSFASGGSVIDGPSIADGSVYWGSGYGRVGGSPNNKLYAFSIK